MEKIKRGLLIVFEGLDRVGKSTQVEMLKQNLEKIGHKVEYQRFPDRTTSTGKMLNELLLNKKNMDIKASHLLFSFNRWEKVEEMKETLMQNTTIIVDRYAFSGVVYSLANGAPKEYVLVPDQGLLRPDIVIQLDMPIDEIKKRGGFGEEKYEKEEIQIKVQSNYKLFHSKKYWKIINANNDKELVSNEVFSEVEKIINTYTVSYETQNNNNSNDIETNGFPFEIKQDFLLSENY